MELNSSNWLWIAATAVSIAFSAGIYAMRISRKADERDVVRLVDAHEDGCPMRGKLAELEERIGSVQHELRSEAAHNYFTRAEGEVLKAKMDFMSASIQRIELMVNKIAEKMYQ